MALTLVLGPANSAKAREVFGSYAAAAPRGALLVVPTAGDAEHYSRELAEQGVVLGSVMTFPALVEEVARRAGFAARRLSALQRERVVARVVGSARLRTLARAAEARGFARAAGELISELERSLVAPERFASALRAWGGEDPRRAGYARDVAAIYLGYARELERLDRVDPELFAWRALDALRQAPGRWGSDPVFLYGFDDLHPLERDAVETLARLVGVEVTVSLTYEAGRSALAARAELVEELRVIAERVVELPAVDDYYAPGSRAVLHHVERSLFEPEVGGGRVDPGSAVMLLEAAGARAEAELVACEVLSLVEAGVAPDEIAVVYRSLAAAAPVLARTFSEYGIRAAIDDRVRFAHTALGRGLLGLARCAFDRDPSADDLLRYLRTPGLLERAEVVDRLELEVRQQGVLGAAQARERLGFPLNEIEALAQARHPAAELARHGRRLLAAPHRRAAAVLDGDEQVDARALAAMLRAFDELDELGEELSGKELVELLEELEVAAPARSVPGAVVVSEPLAIRARRFRVVFVCGLEEDEFPRREGSEPFLGDERRIELAACSGLRLRTGEDSLERERYLFYAAISRASERIVLSYRSSDEEGNLELPSPFIADVAELLAEDWRERRRRRLLSDLVWPADEAPTARELARTRAAEACGVSGSEQRLLALTATARAHVRHTQVVSAGALEAFADCPVRWLVERELQPQRLEGESDPLLRGSYMHDTLERVLARLGAAVTPESLPDAIRILEEEVAELSPRLAPGRPEQLRRAVAESIAADLRRYLEWEAEKGCGWEPRWLELRFGFDGEDEGAVPALELGEADERVAVRGAIDRVDVDPEGRRAIVRDYKSGSSRPEYQGARWRGDRQLQVALYMLAVRELLGLEPVAGVYQPLGGGDLRARGVFLEEAPLGPGCVSTDSRQAEELRGELEDASARAVALASRLRAGELVPCPATCSREGCMFPSICRIS